MNRRRGESPSARRSELVYGRNPVLEALRGRRRVLRAWTPRSASVARELAERGLHADVASREELTRLCGSDDHQGVVAEVEPFPYADSGRLLEDEDALVVALDGIQDPQNLGAICRSAECAGASGVVLPERRAAAVTPAVCKASAGAVEHLPVARVRNLADYLAGARERGAWIYGAESGSSDHYTSPDYAGRTVLVFGAEGSGLRPRVRAACDLLVSIPTRGRIESLNASAAAAVLIFEATRGRSQAAGVRRAAEDSS